MSRTILSLDLKIKAKKVQSPFFLFPRVPSPKKLRIEPIFEGDLTQDHSIVETMFKKIGKWLSLNP
jgi:hypothetical protein